MRYKVIEEGIKMLKKELEETIKDLRSRMEILWAKNTFLQDQIEAHKRAVRYSDDLSSAMSTVTDALAHVITDLKRGQR